MNKSKKIDLEPNCSDEVTLKLLTTLEDGSPITQREIAAEVGVALGFANKLIKRAIKKGLLKVSQAPAKRYAYYLTPKGFAEKGRLVGEYMTSSMDFFRQARAEWTRSINLMRLDGRKKIALYQTSELAEIALLTANAMEQNLSGVIDENCQEGQFFGLPIYSSIEIAKNDGIDSVLICSTNDLQEAYSDLRAIFKDDQIYAAAFMHVRRQAAHGFDQKVMD